MDPSRLSYPELRVIALASITKCPGDWLDEDVEILRAYMAAVADQASMLRTRPLESFGKDST